jgi:hypothetical protein
LFRGDRWLASGGAGDGSNGVGAVTAVAASKFEPAASGTRTVWVATTNGLARISGYNTTLDAKADAYTAQAAANARHLWIATVGLSAYGDVDAVAVPAVDGPAGMHTLTINPGAALLKRDGDNDGLWTAMYVGAMAAKAHVASTTAEQDEARALAWKHFAAMEFLHNVTGGYGFIARTAVKCGEAHGNGDPGICNSTSPYSCGWVRCAFSDRNLHSRMPLDPTHVRLKRTHV